MVSIRVSLARPASAGRGEHRRRTLLRASTAARPMPHLPAAGPHGRRAAASGRSVGWRDVPASWPNWRRDGAAANFGEADAPSIYLVLIYDLQRLRDLRKQEDDFSFSRGRRKANPAKQFAALLREGPPLGIHVLIWCDTLNNLYRTFDRQALREFETRILFQMSVADSSTLIDSPAGQQAGRASRLSAQRRARPLEKFRPYSLPNDEWLARTAQLCARRSDVAASTNPG